LLLGKTALHEPFELALRVREGIAEAAHPGRRADLGLLVVPRHLLESLEVLFEELLPARIAEAHGLDDLGARLERLRPARIARDEHEIALRERLLRDAEVVRRMVRHVVGRVVRGLAVLANVRAEERNVAGVTRPAPVVDLAAIVAYADGGRPHEAHVADLE